MRSQIVGWKEEDLLWVLRELEILTMSCGKVICHSHKHFIVVLCFDFKLFLFIWSYDAMYNTQITNIIFWFLFVYLNIDVNNQ